MLKEVFIKIGQHTIKIYKNLSKNKQKVNEEKIENKTFNELIKQNKNKENKIKKDFLFIPLLFITVFIITKSMDLSLKLGILLIGYPILKSNIPKIKSEKRKKKKLFENFLML